MHINYKLKYLGIIFVFILGYFLFYNFPNLIQKNTFCIFKNITGLPCPACGSTRATLLLFNGQFWDSILINPFGILTNILVIISIFWIITDIVKNKETFLPFLKRDWNINIKIFILLIVLSNWIWNISKGI